MSIITQTDQEQVNDMARQTTIKRRFLAELQNQLNQAETQLRLLESLSNGTDHYRFGIQHHLKRISTLKESIRRYTA